jgi:hypothetical protein
MPPYNRFVAIAEIESALRCPVDWTTVFQIATPADFYPLECLWRDTVEKYAVDSEPNFLHPWESLNDESDDYLKPMHINVQTWAERAREEYCSLVFRFTHLKYASREIYGKHAPPPGSPTPGQIDILSAKTGISRFYKDIPADFMLSAFLHGIFFHFDAEGVLFDGPIRDNATWGRLLHDPNCRLIFRSPCPIGATSGRPTQHLCFELDASTPIVHGYPISKNEADRIRGSSPPIMVDDLRDWGL